MDDFDEFDDNLDGNDDFNLDGDGGFDDLNFESEPKKSARKENKQNQDQFQDDNWDNDNKDKIDNDGFDNMEDNNDGFEDLEDLDDLDAENLQDEKVQEVDQQQNQFKDEQPSYQKKQSPQKQQQQQQVQQQEQNDFNDDFEDDFDNEDDGGDLEELGNENTIDQKQNTENKKISLCNIFLHFNSQPPISSFLENNKKGQTQKTNRVKLQKYILIIIHTFQQITQDPLRSKPKDFSNYSPYYNKIKDILKQDSKQLSSKQLKRESIQLRNNLKDINKELTKLIERKGGSFFVVEKPKTFDNKPIEHQIKILKRDIVNSTNMLKLKKKEYQVIKGRFEKISKPGFKHQLLAEIENLENQIKQAKKLNRETNDTQRFLTKDLDKLEQIGQPKALIQLHDTEYNIAVFKQKNNQLIKRNDAFDKELDIQKEKLQQCFAKLQAKRAEAKKLNIKESIQMQKRFEKSMKKEKQLETNVKARNKMFKAKLRQLKRDTDQVINLLKINEQKQALIDKEIDRQDDHLGQLMQHERLKEYNVEQILMQVTLSTQGKFTSKGFKQSKSRQSNKSRNKSRQQLKNPNDNQLSVVKSNFQGEQKNSSLIKTKPNKPNFGKKRGKGKQQHGNEFNNVQETQSKVFNTQVIEPKKKNQKSKDEFDLDFDSAFDIESKSKEQKQQSARNKKNDDLDMNMDFDFDLNEPQQVLLYQIQQPTRKRQQVQQNDFGGDFDIPDMQESSKPKKKQQQQQNNDDFNLDSFDLNEPTQVKRKKQVNNNDDDFGLDDMDFGGGNTKKKPQVQNDDLDLDFDF